jgi:apolipoprotein D and lipocalin family protein
MKSHLCAVLLLVMGCTKTTTERLALPTLPTVSSVELERYLGTWYEIASYPQSFQEGCTATTANYTLQEDGAIKVVNRCREGALDGKERVSEGEARVVDKATNAKLEVNFFGPFWGDYWIVDVGPNYEYAVVGHPSRDYLWILSRRTTMAPELYESLLTKVESLGYDRARLNRTLQPPA